MSEDRKRVLDLLAAGKINSDEAERLLTRLEARGEGPGRDRDASSGRPGVPSFLRVVVDSTDGDKVNIRVPLALIRTGIKLTTMLPSDATEKIRDAGIDLGQFSQLADEDLTRALEELTVDVDSADGDKVRIFCE